MSSHLVPALGSVEPTRLLVLGDVNEDDVFRNHGGITMRFAETLAYVWTPIRLRGTYVVL
jgi:hypothetical protein